MAEEPKRFIIITTIQHATPAVRDFAEIPGWQVVVVGDRKTPADWDLPGAVYLGPEAQRDLFGGLADAIPWNHYARKNLGYLYAIRQGAGLIAESDDDNAPLAGWAEAVLPEHVRLQTVTSPSVVNIYRRFTDEHIWPRGLPLDLVLSSEDIRLEDRGEQKVLATQYLADGEPDVDAVYRFVCNRPSRFQQREPVVLGEGVFAPSNSQNTVWRPDAFAFMYLPAFVTFRFTDILRGWIAQRCIWAAGGRMAFGPATVFQERNEHDLFRDLEHEIPCYLQSGPVIEALRSLSLPESPGDILIGCYEKLLEMGVVTAEELRPVKLWCDEVARACGA